MRPPMRRPLRTPLWGCSTQPDRLSRCDLIAAREQPAHPMGGTLPVEGITEPSSGRAFSWMPSLGLRRLRGDLLVFPLATGEPPRHVPRRQSAVVGFGAFNRISIAFPTAANANAPVTCVAAP